MPKPTLRKLIMNSWETGRYDFITTEYSYCIVEDFDGKHFGIAWPSGTERPLLRTVCGLPTREMNEQ